MSDCCTPKGYRQLFSERSAHRQARRYRRSGLDAISRQVVGLLRRRGLEGRTLLEVGGGVGAMQIELLKAGLARAVNVELTPTYEGAAGALLRDAGVEARVDRRLLDFAERSAEFAEADIVVLNRVVCCYPDMPRLVGAAADRTRQVLVLTFPRRAWWTRLALALGNLFFRVARCEFHVFLHSPERIRATAEQHGLTAALNEPGPFWQLAAFERRAR